MRLRGIDGPVPALPLLVFVDELVDAGLACELDWREEPDAVLRAVASLRMASSGNDLPDDADVDVPDAADCEQTLAAIGRALEPYGVALIQLETNTDSYVVSCVALSDLPTLRERALTAGVRLEEVRVDRSPPGRWRIGGS
jgi:hypothetical protein